MMKNFFRTIALTVGIIAITATPAFAEYTIVESRTWLMPNGLGTTVYRYADWTNGQSANKLTIDSSDTSGGYCTETWVDYKTNDYSAYTGQLFVNCSGEWWRLSDIGAQWTRSIVGMDVVVCRVPNVDDYITLYRDLNNSCRGDISGINWQYLNNRTYAEIRTVASNNNFKVNYYRTWNG